MAERRRILTKVELLALELLIAVAQQKGVSPSSVLKDDLTKAMAFVDRAVDKAMAAAFAAGKLKINEKVINPQILAAAGKIGSEPTLKQLMELHTEAVKNIK